MAFPAVVTANISKETVDTTTHDVLLPTGIASGDRLFLFAILDGTPTTISGMPSGWTKIVEDDMSGGGGLSYSLWEKIGATGSETDFTYTSSASENSTNRTWRVQGAHASTATPTTVTHLSGFGTVASWDALTPSWGAEDTLWVAVAGTDGNRTVSAYSYADNQFTDNSTNGIDGTSVMICSRNLNAATETPGTMTINTNGNWITATLAIRTAAGGGGTTVTDPFGMSGFFG